MTFEGAYVHFDVPESYSVGTRVAGTANQWRVRVPKREKKRGTRRGVAGIRWRRRLVAPRRPRRELDALCTRHP